MDLGKFIAKNADKFGRKWQIQIRNKRNHWETISRLSNYDSEVISKDDFEFRRECRENHKRDDGKDQDHKNKGDHKVDNNKGDHKVDKNKGDHKVDNNLGDNINKDYGMKKKY